MWVCIVCVWAWGGGGKRHSKGKCWLVIKPLDVTAAWPSDLLHGRTLGVWGWGWRDCEEKGEGRRWRSLAEQIPLSHRVEKGPLSVHPLPPVPSFIFLPNNAKSWQPTQRHEQQFPIKDRQPSYRLGTSHVCRTTASVRREQTRMGVFEGKEEHISLPSWSDCGESASLTQQNGQKWLYLDR